jgi:hypothetical protein
MDVTANVVIALVALVSLTFSGFGAWMQAKSTADQLQQSNETREREQKEDAALFDVRSEGSTLYLTNYSRHTVRSIEVFMYHAERGKRYLFPVRTVGPCRAVVYTFKYKSKGKVVPSHLNLDQVAYEDWEGIDWATGGGLPLTHIDDKYRSRMRKKSVMWAEWDKLLDWPRKETEISDCAGR